MQVLSLPSVFFFLIDFIPYKYELAAEKKEASSNHKQPSGSVYSHIDVIKQAVKQRLKYGMQSPRMTLWKVACLACKYGATPTTYIIQIEFMV